MLIASRFIFLISKSFEMLISSILLLLFCFPSGSTEEVDCDAVLGSLPETVKKTKTWKNCLKENEKVLHCEENGFKVCSAYDNKRHLFFWFRGFT